MLSVAIDATSIAPNSATLRYPVRPPRPSLFPGDAPEGQARRTRA